MRNKRVEKSITDSDGNKISIMELTLIFNRSKSSLYRDLWKNKCISLIELVKLLEKPRIYASNTIFVPDKYGRTHMFSGMRRMFGKSNTWLLNCHHKHGCKTLEDYQHRLLNETKTLLLDKKGQEEIDKIPSGSWEDKNIKCPSANTKTPRSVRRDIYKEESGGRHSKERWNDAYWKKQERRSATTSEMKEALYLLEDNPVLKETVPEED